LDREELIRYLKDSFLKDVERFGGVGWQVDDLLIVCEDLILRRCLSDMIIGCIVVVVVVVVDGRKIVDVGVVGWRENWRVQSREIVDDRVLCRCWLYNQIIDTIILIWR
jgi:hypothetical protein